MRFKEHPVMDKALIVSRDKLRFAEIDLLRFLAAFSVMIYHFTVGGFLFGVQILPVQYHQLIWFTKYGYLGVDLFFLISGFVIFLTVMGRTPAEFVVSRAVRLYPAFWASCTLTYLISSYWGPDILKITFKAYLANMTMFHWFFSGKFVHVDPVYWSLVVELKFYILVFVLVLARQIRHAQYWLGLWLVISLVSLILPSVFMENVLITRQSANFIAGGIYYLTYRDGINLYKIVVLLGSYLLSVCNALLMLTGNINTFQIPFDPNVLVLIITVMYALFLLIALNKLDGVRYGFFIKLGAITYPLYLLHSKIGFVIFNNVYPLIDKDLLLALIIMSALILAWLVHVHVEVKCSARFRGFLERCFLCLKRA